MTTPAFTGHDGLRWRGTPLLPETAKALEHQLERNAYNSEDYFHKDAQRLIRELRQAQLEAGYENF